MTTIKEADNGWVISYPSNNTEGITTEVVEYPEHSDEGDKEYEEAVERLLYRVMQSIGVWGSKHNKYRTFIKVVNQSDEDEK